MLENTPAGNPTRLAAYKALLDEVGIDPEENIYSGEEDAALTLAGHPDYPLCRYAAVTYSSEYVYVTLRPSFKLAADYAVSNCTDNLYAEAPGRVIDLDTGETYEPDWDNLPWKKL